MQIRETRRLSNGRRARTGYECQYASEGDLKRTARLARRRQYVVLKPFFEKIFDNNHGPRPESRSRSPGQTGRIIITRVHETAGEVLGKKHVGPTSSRCSTRLGPVRVVVGVARSRGKNEPAVLGGGRVGRGGGFRSTLVDGGCIGKVGKVTVGRRGAGRDPSVLYLCDVFGSCEGVRVLRKATDGGLWVGSRHGGGAVGFAGGQRGRR